MAREKIPQWKKDFKRRMTAHNKALGAEFPTRRLTKFTYTNGTMEYKRKPYSRHYLYHWIPTKEPSA